MKTLSAFTATCCRFGSPGATGEAMICCSANEPYPRRYSQSLRQLKISLLREQKTIILTICSTECTGTSCLLHLTQNLRGSLFSHQCRRGGTGYPSSSIILKIVLNIRSFPGAIFPRFLRYWYKGRRSAKANGERRSGSFNNGGLGRRAHRCAKNTCGLKRYFLRPTPQPATDLHRLSFSLFFLIYHQPDREAECPKQIPPFDPPLLWAWDCSAYAHHRTLAPSHN